MGLAKFAHLLAHISGNKEDAKRAKIVEYQTSPFMQIL